MVPSSQASNHADFPSLPLDILRIHKGPLQDDQITAHIGRHTFATTLIRSGTDLVIVADLLGHARLEQSAPIPVPPTQTETKPSSSYPPTADQQPAWPLSDISRLDSCMGHLAQPPYMEPGSCWSSPDISEPDARDSRGKATTHRSSLEQPAEALR